MPTSDELIQPVRVAILQDVIHNMNSLLPTLRHRINVGIVCAAFVQFKCDKDVQAFLNTCANRHLLSGPEFSQLVILLHGLYDRALVQLVHFYSVTEGYEEVLGSTSDPFDDRVDVI